MILALLLGWSTLLPWNWHHRKVPLCRYTAPNNRVVACADHAGQWQGGVTFTDQKTGVSWYRKCPTCEALFIDWGMPRKETTCMH